MELVSTMEISGEEREIADAYARGQIEGVNSNLSDKQDLLTDSVTGIKAKITLENGLMCIREI